MNQVLATVLEHPVTQAVGAALLHSLWQIGVLGGVLFIVLRLARRTSAELRYCLAAATLLLSVFAAVGTGMLHYAASIAPGLTEAHGAMNSSIAHAQANTPMVSRIVNLQSWLGIVWALVASVLLLRLGLELVAARRLVRVGVSPVPEAIAASAQALAYRLNLTRVVQVLQSHIVMVPVVIGWLRPVVLLPAAMISGLSHAQLEMLLAHELAHVQRFDFMVNALQRVIEVLLFYHPVARWVSRQISLERENCCDDVAVRLCSDRVGYARALAAAAEFRFDTTPVFALGVVSDAMPLKARIVRMLPPVHGRSRRQAPGKLPGLLAVLLAFLLASVDMAPKQVRDAVVTQLLQLPVLLSSGADLSNRDWEAMQSDAMPPPDSGVTERIPRADPAAIKPVSAGTGKNGLAVQPDVDSSGDRAVAARLEALVQRASGGRPVRGMTTTESLPQPQEVSAQARIEEVAGESIEIPAPGLIEPIVAKPTPAKLTFAPQPRYPETARRRLLEGVVRVQFSVTTNGRVADIRFLGRPQLYLSRSVASALHEWRFEPATENGHAVTASLQREFVFRFDRLGSLPQPATTGTRLH